MSQNDSNLLSILYGEFVEKKESNLNEKYDNYFITTKELFRLLKEYKIIENNKFNQYIIENSCFISYNKMLEEHFNGVLDARIYRVLYDVYKPDRMDLRNTLMHCGSGNFDYYGIEVTYFLLVLSISVFM